MSKEVKISREKIALRGLGLEVAAILMLGFCSACSEEHLPGQEAYRVTFPPEARYDSGESFLMVELVNDKGQEKINFLRIWGGDCVFDPNNPITGVWDYHEEGISCVVGGVGCNKVAIVKSVPGCTVQP